METENSTAIPPVNPTNFDSNMHDPESEIKNIDDDLAALSRVSAAISSLSNLKAILQIGLDSVLDIMDGAAGLFSMKERVKLLGGNCSVQSQRGQGTTVTARVPMAWSTANEKDKSTSSR